MIRNFELNDVNKIKELNFYNGLLYEYNRDFEKENILCYVENEHILGFAHLEPDNTYFAMTKIEEPNFYGKLKLGLVVNNNIPNSEEVKFKLLAAILSRAKEIKNSFPNKKMKVINYFMNDEIEEMKWFMKNGFYIDKAIVVMKRDLTKPIFDLPEIENLKIIQRKINTIEEKEEYLKVEGNANKGVSMSMNQLNWNLYAPTMNNFSAYYKNQFVGNVMTWKFSDDHAATENIFVDPSYQQKGIAKYMITETLKSLKNLGFKLVTLSVYKDNRKAISLYQSLEYEIQNFIYEFSYDL